MSTFEDDAFRWRETYFVMFESRRRPKLEKVQSAIAGLNAHFELTNQATDAAGLIESLTILSADDFAALDVSYLEGEEVVEQALALADEMDGPVCGAEDRGRLEKILLCDARFDVLHFERLIASEEAEQSDELLDPSTLLIVLEALAELTGGVPIDPQGNAMM